MRKIFNKSLARALIITIIAAVVIVGGIYAYETLWSGTGRLTIVSPTDGAVIEVTEVHVSTGTWDESTDTWTASLSRGGIESIVVRVTNTGGDVATIYYYVSDANPAPGVTINSDSGSDSGWTTTGYNLAAGKSQSLTFQVRVDADAEPGTLPEFQLRLGK